MHECEPYVCDAWKETINAWKANDKINVHERYVMCTAQHGIWFVMYCM